MGLSSNDYSSDQKEKLLHIEDGANKYVHPETHPASMIAEDETHRFVTSEEKALIGTNISSNGSADIKYLYRGYVYKIGNYQNVNIGSLERHYLRQVHVYNPSPSHTCSIHGFYCSFIKADFEELKE